jgi:TonB-linked SusC/RagA family outer membrane protein
MKSRLLPHIWPKTRCALLGYVILTLLSLPALANNGPGPGPRFDSTISGKISDTKGTALAGVNIIEKGTNNGVTTNDQGNFSITVKSASSVLVISFVGYTTQEISVNSITSGPIVLSPVSGSLDDVVVVGYGTQKKASVTTAIVQTTGAELKKSNAVSLSNSLSGRLAGLFVNQRSSVPGFDDAQILIRGPRSYRSTGALIVIDGIANADPDGLSRLDPNDIETISVLKDASAAIYGAQAAGGVILVTTKRGKTGKTAVDFSSTFSWQSPTMRIKSADVYQYMTVLNERRALEGQTPDFPDAIFDAFRSGTRRPEDWYAALVDAPAPQNRQSLTLRGGTERIKYFVSLGTAVQKGILRGDDKTKLQQYNVRSNIDVNVFDGLDVGIDLSYRQKNTQTPQGSPGGDIGYFAITSPLQEAYLDGDYRYPGEGWSQSNPAARLLSPGYRRYKVDVLSGTARFKLAIPFVKGLALEGYANVVKNVWYNKIFNYTWFYYERGANPGEYVKKVSRTIEDIGLREEFSQSLQSTQNIKLSYNTTIAGDHRINAFFSYEQMDYKDNGFNAQRLGFASPLIDQLFAGSTDRQNWSNDGRASESARRNYLGRVTYDYAGKYLAEFSARYDGSPIFPEETRYGFFPQASVGWVLSNENFIPRNIFSNLKLRASWGQLGNDGQLGANKVAPFQYIGAFGYTTGWVIGGIDSRGIAATTTPNPNITWEVTETTDLGLEAGFLQNKLTLEVDLFNTKTKNILGRRQASIPGYTGLALPDENIGKMDSKGFEVQAGYRQDFGQVGFRINGNFSYVKNKIIYFDEAPQAEPYQKLEGQPLGSILVYKSIGIYREAGDLTKYTSYPGAKLGGLIFADLNNDGVINSNDRYRFDQTSFPKSTFGITIGLDYKNFDLTMLLQGQDGAKWRLFTGFNSGANGNGLTYVAENSFSLDNTNSELPMINNTGVGAENSDFYYHNVTFLRMKSVELGYTMPRGMSQRVKINALRFYVSGDNLFMILNSLNKYGGGDPEFNSEGGNNGNMYPNMRTISVGANITF